MDNKEIVRRLSEEAWTNPDVIDELASADYVGHDPSQPEPTRGPEGIKEFIKMYRAAYPDATLTVERQIGEGDYVASYWTARGTQQGELMGIPATGKQVTVTGITISRVTDGKVSEETTVWDTLGMLQQLGVVEAPTPAQT